MTFRGLVSPLMMLGELIVHGCWGPGSVFAEKSSRHRCRILNGNSNNRNRITVITKEKEKRRGKGRDKHNEKKRKWDCGSESEFGFTQEFYFNQ